MMPDTVYNTMIDGLTQLHLLRLPSAPPADGLEAVALVWERALTVRIQWCEDDAIRLATAFQHTAATADRWPLPKDVIAHLPPRPPAPALPQPQAVPCPPHIAEMLMGLADKMKI